MLPSPKPRRILCRACLRPQTDCLCRWVTPTLQGVEVLILQHPLEAGHAKNTAQLLQLSLTGSRLVVGESFDGRVLTSEPESRNTLLLYPDTPAEQGMAPAAPLDASWLQAPRSLRLIVLDATWRKSRKMLHLNPWLQRLPRLSLQETAASRYLIRKAHQPGQLSTLEATCAALAQLQDDAEKYRPLLQAFDGFVAHQLAQVPRDPPLSRPGQ